jgi:hypothetical protein
VALAEADRPALLAALQCQRASVRAIVNGLSEQHWHTSVVPSGWTPLAWSPTSEARNDTDGSSTSVRTRATLFDADFADEPYDPLAPFVIDWPPEKVLGLLPRADPGHRFHARRDGPRRITKGRHGGPDTKQPATVRKIVLHLIREPQPTRAISRSPASSWTATPGWDCDSAHITLQRPRTVEQTRSLMPESGDPTGATPREGQRSSRIWASGRVAHRGGPEF